MVVDTLVPYQNVGQLYIFVRVKPVPVDPGYLHRVNVRHNPVLSQVLSGDGELSRSFPLAGAWRYPERFNHAVYLHDEPGAVIRVKAPGREVVDYNPHGVHGILGNGEFIFQEIPGVGLGIVFIRYHGIRVPGVIPPPVTGIRGTTEISAQAYRFFPVKIGRGYPLGEKVHLVNEIRFIVFVRGAVKVHVLEEMLGDDDAVLDVERHVERSSGRKFRQAVRPRPRDAGISAVINTKSAIIISSYIVARSHELHLLQVRGGYLLEFEVLHVFGVEQAVFVDIQGLVEHEDLSDEDRARCRVIAADPFEFHDVPAVREEDRDGDGLEITGVPRDRGYRLKFAVDVNGYLEIPAFGDALAVHDVQADVIFRVVRGFKLVTDLAVQRAGHGHLPANFLPERFQGHVIASGKRHAVIRVPVAEHEGVFPVNGAVHVEVAAVEFREVHISLGRGPVDAEREDLAVSFYVDELVLEI